MSERRPLCFDGVDATYRDAFLEACGELVYPPYFEPILDFCLEGGFERGELVRLANMIPDKSSPPYKAYTGEGVHAKKRRAEREKIDAHLLDSTRERSTGVMVDAAWPTNWPDAIADVFRFAAILPEGLNLIELARAEPVTGANDRDRLIAAARIGLSFARRLRTAGQRGPLLSLQQDATFVRALMEVALRTPIEWAGRVSPQQDLSFLSFEALQPGRADNIDVFELLDSSMPNEHGEAFGHGAHKGRTLVAYRPHEGDSCYMQISRTRAGATRDDVEMSMRRAVGQLRQLPDDLSSFALDTFYAVRKTARGETQEAIDVPYKHTTRMLVLAHQYPLFTLRRGHMPITPIPDQPGPMAAPDIRKRDSAEGLR